jgi:hypothetical protein
MRFETISFFVVGLLLSALVIKLLWNRLARDFLSPTQLPVRRRLRRPLGPAVHPGADDDLRRRELMTPGAWQKQGFTYRLAESAKTEPKRASTAFVGRSSPGCGSVLWFYAEAHGGRFPTDIADSDCRRRCGRRPTPPACATSTSADNRGSRFNPLAYEPELYGPRRLVLLTAATFASWTAMRSFAAGWRTSR